MWAQHFMSRGVARALPLTNANTIASQQQSRHRQHVEARFCEVGK